MKKQIIISIVVVLLVVILDFITQKYTEESMEEILGNLEEVRNDITEQKEEKIENRHK